MKIYTKNLITLFSSLILLFSSNLSTTLATNKITYDLPQNISYQKYNISAFGKYPIISNLKNKEFEKNLNSEINSIIDKTLLSKKDSISKKFDISYKTFISGNNFSIVLFFKNISSGETTIKSIVFDLNKFKKLSLTYFLGPNGITYANKVVENKADDFNLKHYKVSLDTPFYIENGKVTILYGAGETTFVQKGNIAITIDPKKITNYYIYKDQYYKKSDYNVKMIPLREPLESLGYDIIWNENNNISIFDDENYYALTLNENKYSKGSFISRPLEFAPETKNNITYVPISFYSDIIGLLYSIDSSEHIVISKYDL